MVAKIPIACQYLSVTTSMQCCIISVPLRQELFSYRHFNFRHAVAFLKPVGSTPKYFTALHFSSQMSKQLGTSINSCVKEQQEQTTKALDKYKTKAVKGVQWIFIYSCQSTPRQGIHNCKSQQLQ